MPHPLSPHGARQDRLFAIVLGGFLALCWALGGVTEDRTPADELLQLLALPILPWALWRLAAAPIDRPRMLALTLALCLLLVPAWQLLPLPQAMGWSGATRGAILTDLAAAGVVPDTAHASLSPVATERALWSLLPALALFLGVLSLPRPWLRRALQLVLALALASAAFAFFQLSLPDGSPLLLYTSWGRNFGGLFVNANHQGSALAIAAVIALSLFLEARRRAREDERPGHRHWLYALLAAICVVLVPLANGSAAVLLLFIGLLVAWLLLAAARQGRRRLLSLAAAAVVGGIVLSSALAWGQMDTQRRAIATQALALGGTYAPLGAGVGGFVPVFAQAQDRRSAGREVINHAHDEYVQWWLEAGVPALLVAGFALGVFAWAGWQVLARVPSRRLRALAAPAWTGLLLLLLHSLVDFPLRTTTLMATAGLLAGVLLATLSLARREIRTPGHPDVAPQPA